MWGIPQIAYGSRRAALSPPLLFDASNVNTLPLRFQKRFDRKQRAACNLPTAKRVKRRQRVGAGL
jgi:hypothetical protein